MRSTFDPSSSFYIEVFLHSLFSVRCKKPVVAEKRFTIDEAPLVLTIHLKRFSPLGKKIGHLVQYAERLTLEPYMSEGEFGPAYSLYGVISHAGGGPHSGHYYAHVKAGDGHWYEMNDESVQRVHAAPTDRKSAYVLFYVRERGQALQAAIGSSAVREEKAQAPLLPPAIMKVGIKAAMKKRKISQGNEDDENRGTKTPRTDASSSPLKAKKPFIGPLLPKSASVVGDSSPGGLGTPHPDPQAMTLGKKIAAVKAAAVPEPKASPALASLVQYDDSDEEDLGESVGELPMPASHTQAPPELVPTLNLHGTGAMRGQKLETPFPRSSSPAMKGEKFKIASPAGLVNNDTVATNNDDGSGSDSDDYVDAPSSAASSAIAARVRTPLSPSRPRPRTGTGGGHFSLGTGVHRGRPSFGGGNPFSKLVGSNNLHDRRSPHKRPAHKYGRHHRRH